MLPPTTHEEVAATLIRFKQKNRDLEGMLDKAYGYAVFPAVARASAIIGGSFGHGEVFEQGRSIGFARLSELTIGVQVGGQTLSELLLFGSKESLEQFKQNKVAFAANASAALVKAAASGTNDFRGVQAFALSRGGMLLEASLGGQKITFTPAPGGPALPQQAEGDGAEASVEASKEPPAPVAAPGADAAAGAQGAAGQAMEGLGDAAEAAAARGGRGPSVRKGPVRGALFAMSRVAGKLGAPKGPLKAVRAAVLGRHGEKVMAGPFKRIQSLAAALGSEQKARQVLHPDVEAAVLRVTELDPQLREELANAYGFAVFPSVGGASAVLGGAYGTGEVYKKGRLIGYAAIIQLTLGVQVGGETFTEIAIFKDEEALERFRSGKVGFTSGASAVALKAGLAKSSRHKGIAVYVHSDGGLQLRFALGGQKFIYRPAAMTRGTKAPALFSEARGQEESAPQGVSPSGPEPSHPPA